MWTRFITRSYAFRQSGLIATKSCSCSIEKASFHIGSSIVNLRVSFIRTLSVIEHRNPPNSARPKAQTSFAVKSRNLHLNPGANVGAIAPLFKCKVPFGKARGPAEASNRRTSHIRGRSGLAVRSNVWDKGTCPVTKMGRHLLRDLTAKRGLCSANKLQN